MDTGQDVVKRIVEWELDTTLPPIHSAMLGAVREFTDSLLFREEAPIVIETFTRWLWCEGYEIVWRSDVKPSEEVVRALQTRGQR